PESRNFGWPFWVTAITDSDGRWQLNRLAKETIHTLYGSASHSNHAGSAMVFLSRSPEGEAELLAGTYVFNLGRAVSVEGIVVSDEGKPVAGASAWLDTLRASLRMTMSKTSRKFRPILRGKAMLMGVSNGTAPRITNSFRFLGHGLHASRRHQDAAGRPGTRC